MSFRDIERSFFDLYWQIDPVAATQTCVPGHDDRYGRYGNAALAPHLAALKSIASAVEQTAVADREEEIDRTALLNEIRVMLRRYEKIKPQATNPEFWLSHLLGGLHHLLLSADRTPAEKAVAAIGRLEDIPAFLDDLRATLEEPVRVFVETAVRMTAGGRLLVKELATALGSQAPRHAARLTSAAEEAHKALYSFDANLERWLEMGSEQHERIRLDHCPYELTATALHEGYPGHHLQLVIAKEQASHVRKNLWTALTVEGWALYCEDMMGEQGFYTSDQELFFQRVHLLWRAMRILLDVGLHTRGLTRDQAVDQMVSELHVERCNAAAEVRRYCAWPAYQLCYAVGRRELLRLRDDFRKAKGNSFSLRAFHDAVLPYGGLPVTLIRWGLGLGE